MVESTARFLDGLPLPAIMVFSLILPFPLILVHELGHAVMALSRVNGPVTVHVGRARGRTPRTLGRLTFKLDRLAIWMQLRDHEEPHGICLHAPATSRADTAAIAAGGPAASLLLAVALAVAASWSHSYTGEVVLAVGAAAALFEGLYNLVPRTHTLRGGLRLRTDGGVILEALRGRPAPRVGHPLPLRLWIHPTAQPASDPAGPSHGSSQTTGARQTNRSQT